MACAATTPKETPCAATGNVYVLEGSVLNKPWATEPAEKLVIELGAIVEASALPNRRRARL